MECRNRALLGLETSARVPTVTLVVTTCNARTSLSRVSSDMLIAAELVK